MIDEETKRTYIIFFTGESYPHSQVDSEENRKADITIEQIHE